MNTTDSRVSLPTLAMVSTVSLAAAVILSLVALAVLMAKSPGSEGAFNRGLIGSNACFARFAFAKFNRDILHRKKNMRPLSERVKGYFCDAKDFCATQTDCLYATVT